MLKYIAFIAVFAPTILKYSRIRASNKLCKSLHGKIRHVLLVFLCYAYCANTCKLVLFTELTIQFKNTKFRCLPKNYSSQNNVLALLSIPVSNIFLKHANDQKFIALEFELKMYCNDPLFFSGRVK